METVMNEAFFQSEGRKMRWDSLLQSVVRHAGEGRLAIVDKNLVVLYATEGYYTRPDLAGRAIIGRHLYELFPNATHEWRDINERVLGGESVRYDRDVYVQRDGSIEHIRWASFPWYGADGEIGGLVLYTMFIDDPARGDEARMGREAAAVL
ncbi:MAG: PAS domain-containing protein [Spirochaetia bacterium]|nr:PAS domain-containing protein [Spirochaetia bacterium]